MNQCTVCGQKADQLHSCGGTPTLPGHEVPRYTACHHFAVVMSDECPWCLKTKLEETLLQIGDKDEELSIRARTIEALELQNQELQKRCGDLAHTVVDADALHLADEQTIRNMERLYREALNEIKSLKALLVPSKKPVGEVPAGAEKICPLCYRPAEGDKIHPECQRRWDAALPDKRKGRP